MPSKNTKRRLREAQQAEREMQKLQKLKSGADHGVEVEAEDDGAPPCKKQKVMQQKVLKPSDRVLQLNRALAGCAQRKDVQR